MRIVCLSAESADICARLGAWEEVVAVSAFACQEGLQRRPVISGFSTCDCERVAELAPDLVITFSDVQAEIAGSLIRAGCAVLATNQRTLSEIADTIRLIGGAIGRAVEAERLAAEFTESLDALTTSAEPRPRVYFEEWPEPMISGIGWVGELIERAGGIDLFAHRRSKAARNRTLSIQEVAAADPDIILASWCGKRVDLLSIRNRAGMENTAAVRTRQIYALDSNDLLQPGPRLVHGLRAIRQALDGWRAATCQSGMVTSL